MHVSNATVAQPTKKKENDKRKMEQIWTERNTIKNGNGKC